LWTPFFEAFWAVLFLKVRGREGFGEFSFGEKWFTSFFDNKHE